MKYIFIALSLAGMFFTGRHANAEQESLYTLPLRWQDDTGAARSLSDFKGAPVLLTLAYTKCKSACPLTMRRLRSVAEQVSDCRKDTKFVVISLDPAADTPEELAKFRSQYKLSSESWALLRGSEEDLRALSVLLDYGYQRAENNVDVHHSNKIVALDEKGSIVSELEGLNSGTEPLVASLCGNSKERSGS